MQLKLFLQQVTHCPSQRLWFSMRNLQELITLKLVKENPSLQLQVVKLSVFVVM